MANEKRSRTNNVGGLIEDNPLTNAATTLTSAALSALPVIDTTNHAVIVLDPDGLEGAPEIVYVTAHTSGATTATIVRAQEGSSGLQHSVDVPWVHTFTVKDFDGSGGGAGLIGFTAYEPGAAVATSTTSATLADVDATNLVVPFTAPPSGKVLVRLTAQATVTNTTQLAWGLREATTNIASENVLYNSATSQVNARVSAALVVSGLVAGSSHSYKWSHSRSSGTGSAQTYYGGTNPDGGPAIMEVWAVNL